MFRVGVVRRGVVRKKSEVGRTENDGEHLSKARPNELERDQDTYVY